MLVGFFKKLYVKWEGFYYIVKIIGNNIYGLWKCLDNKFFKVFIYVNCLKVYYDL